MTIPLTLPPWLPWWVPLLILVPLLLYALVFILMPFSVLGLKGRIDTLDARLDEIQGEIRSLALRLPEPMRASHDEPPYVSPPPMPQFGPERGGRSIPPPPVVTARPPIPPAPLEPGFDGRGTRRDPRTNRSEPRPPRAEPKLDWPRS